MHPAERVPPAPPDKPIPTVPPDKAVSLNPLNPLNTSNYFAPIATIDPQTHTEPIVQSACQLNELNIVPQRSIVFKPSIRPLLKLPCIINDWTSATVMIDSGAACNCITRRFAAANGIEILDTEPLNITLADKSVTSSNQICHVRVTLPSVNVTFGCVLVVLNESSHDVILGINFLETFNPSINWKNRTVNIDKRQVNIDLKRHVDDALEVLLNTFSLDDAAATPTDSAGTLPDIEVISFRNMRKLQRDADNQFCMIQITNTIPSTPTSQLTLNNIEVIDTPIAEQRVFNEHEERIVKEFADVFAPIAKGLPPKRAHDHSIELLPGAQPVSKPAYRLSATENDELKRQLDKLIAHGHIRASRSPFGSPVLFVKKKDGTQRMCVDYRALNNITVKNAYPLPRVDELLDRLSGAKYFSKIDLQQGYHQVRVNPADVEKTAFRTRYGSYEFLVLPFGLTNAPSTFMHLMQDVLAPFLDKFAISFLDDILIYSHTLAEHNDHVNQVLSKLREHKLQAKLEKCQFARTSIEFLGFIISADGLAMVDNKVQAIVNWPTPRTVKEVRSFLGLAGFYREFIEMFSDTVASLNDLLQKESVFHWADEHQKAFDALKRKIAAQPTLILPRDHLPFVVQTDASGFAVGATLMQDVGKGLQPIAFLSKKMLPAETRYPTHEQELLAIHVALKEWRHYLYGKKFTVQTDHKSIIHFKTQQNMSPRQIRWSEYLQQFDYTIEYKPGVDNVVADALSRRSDHETALTASVNEVTVSTSTNDESILTQIKHAYTLDEYCRTILLNHEAKENSSEWKVDEHGLLRRHEQILVPNDQTIRTTIITCNHDDLTASHRGVAKTVELISRIFYWKNMHRDIKEYISTCISCQQNKVSNQAPLGLLQPIPTPEQRWHTITMDLITSLPRTKNGHDCILVACDKCSKLVHYIPTVTTIDAPGLARLMIDNVVRHHGIPIYIISDRDPRINSHFWKSVWSQLGTKLKMSTAFHPQTDGQTERANRTLEEQLRNYVSYHQDNWDTLLPMLEFAHNNTVSSTTGYSPFFLNTGQHPVTPLTYEVKAQTQINDAAATLIEQLYDSLSNAHTAIDKAQLSQKKYADQHRRDFEQFQENDLVLLSTDHLRTPGRAPKLLPRRIGPFRIVKALSKLNYELELPSTLAGIHNRFHVSLLTRFHSTDSFPSRPNIVTRPPAELLADTKEEAYEVEKVLKHRGTGRRRQYLIHWKGYPDFESTWEPESAFVGHRDAIDAYEHMLSSSHTVTAPQPTPLSRRTTRSHTASSTQR